MQSTTEQPKVKWQTMRDPKTGRLVRTGNRLVWLEALGKYCTAAEELD
jgi:hypothetical protein